MLSKRRFSTPPPPGFELTCNTSIELGSHGNMPVPRPDINTNKPGGDGRVQSVNDNWARVTIPSEDLRVKENHQQKSEASLTVIFVALVTLACWLWNSHSTENIFNLKQISPIKFDPFHICLNVVESCLVIFTVAVIVIVFIVTSLPMSFFIYLVQTIIK